MGCENKIKDTCKKTSSECSKYERDLPEWSELDGCPVIAETTEELYDAITDLQDSLDTSELGQCEEIDYDAEDPTNITPSEFMLALEREVCALKGGNTDASGETNTQNTIDLTKIDMMCLVDPCGEPITDVNVFLQALVTKLCECCP